MRYNRPLYYVFGIVIIYFGVSLILANDIIIHTTKFTATKYLNASLLNFEKRLLSPKEWVFTEKEWSKTIRLSNKYLKHASDEYERAKQLSYYLIVTSGVLFLLITFIYLKTYQFFKALLLSLISIAFVCLYLGICTPVLEIGAFTDNLTIPIKFNTSDIPLLSEIPLVRNRIFDFSKIFEGRVYYYYQNKSIVELINLLFKDGNLLVAIAILCFSVIIPFLKLILSVGIMVSVRCRRISILRFVVNNIGKWSMADVFVVATYLSYLSFRNINAGVETEANVLLGLYYFFSYVIFSITVSFLLKKTND